jgi:hypothetical protein
VLVFEIEKTAHSIDHRSDPSNLSHYIIIIIIIEKNELRMFRLILLSAVAVQAFVVLPPPQKMISLSSLSMKEEERMPMSVATGILMSSALLLGIPSAFAETAVVKPPAIISASKASSSTSVDLPALKATLKTKSLPEKPPVVKSTTATAAKSIKTVPKTGVEIAKQKLSAAVSQRTQAQSELRSAQAAADQARAAYTLAQKNAKQAKQSFINANDRLASMKSAKGVTKTELQVQQKKVGTFFH